MTAIKNTADLQAFDRFLRARCAEIWSEVRERLSEHPLTLSEVRVTRVLIPMVGLYTLWVPETRLQWCRRSSVRAPRLAR
jgi:hypothetical protein